MKRNVSLSLILVFLLPVFLQAGEFQVKVLKDSEDMPESFCPLWKKGDYLISDGKYLILLGGVDRPLRSHLLNFPSANAMGSIIGFAPAGEELIGDISVGSPVIEIEGRRWYIAYSSLKLLKKDPKTGTLSYIVSASYKGEDGKRAEIQTTYTFHHQQGQITIASTIKNTGRIDFKDLDYFLVFDPHHRYAFSPFSREEHPELKFRVYQKKGHYLGMINLNPIPPLEEEDEPRPGRLAQSEEYELQYILLVDSQSEELLQKIYKILGVIPRKASLYFEDFDGEEMEVIVRDVFSNAVFFRSFLQTSHSLDILLPKGVYIVRTHFFPAVCEEFLAVEEGGKNICTLQNPPLEVVKVKIRNSRGEFVPGKVTFIGLDPTKSPYFMPEDPIESGKKWEYFNNSCYPTEEGMEIELPAGTYLVYASRGPEYTLDKKIVEVLKGHPQELDFRIDKVVKTEGFVSLDPHMHTTNSDGRVSIPERIKSVVAEGVDVAVATDHNHISNYHPILEDLGLESFVSIIPGNEVTTKGIIHFNTYPLEIREDEEGNGAIPSLFQEASSLFEESRRKDPKALIQVNHPRDGDIGYFNNYRLDVESASFALTHFDSSFDILEVLNGPYIYSPNNSVSVEDWLHLLNRGYYFPLVGSSDSHSTDKDEPGYFRTYVIQDGRTRNHLEWASLIQALKEGRSFATNGPLVQLKVDDVHTFGELAQALKGEVKVWIEVQSAPWISVDEVRLIINGRRKIVFPVEREGESIQKFTESIGLNLEKDAYIIIEVLGKKSLFPVLQRAAYEGKMENATLPYALTNPVFIDVDGNGRFDPPLPEKIMLKPNIPKTKNLIKRY